MADRTSGTGARGGGHAFQGVHVSSLATVTAAVLVALLATAASTAEARVASATIGTSAGVPYCVFLEPSQELDCVCHGKGQGEGEAQDDGESARLDIVDLFTGTDFVVAENSSSAPVASVKLHGCGALRMRLDLRPLPRPFYRVRVEDVESVAVEGGVAMAANDTVDVWFRNVNGTLDISGGLGCGGGPASCQLKVHAVDCGDISLRGVVADADVDARFQVRDARSLSIEDSFFRGLGRDAIEVFGVPAVSVRHSEFHNSTGGSVLLNRVASANITDSLIERDAVEMLPPSADSGLNATVVRWKCTVSPLSTPSEVLSADELLECSVFGTAASSPSSPSPSYSESAGAIVLAVVSAVLLVVAVTVLAVLHRTGRLDEYL